MSVEHPLRTRFLTSTRLTLADAPKFFCCHCQRPGKTLNHIGRCKGRREPK